MSDFNPDYLANCSSYEGDFRYQGANYSTTWAKVLGPVRERRNYKDTFILVDMWLEEDDPAGKDVHPLIGSPPWCAAMELSRTDTTWLTQEKYELSPFTFRETLDTNPSAWVEADLVFKLGVWDANTWTQFPAPTFFENLVRIMKHYEWHRQKKLRESIFFYHWSRDCDLCESEGIKIFTDWFEAADWISGFGESAEGPQSLSQVTFNQWRKFNAAPMRDRGLEHFEEHGYGH